MNCVILEGRLSKDIATANSGKTATASFAVNRPFPFSKDKDGNDVTDFLNIKFIGDKSVSHAEKFLRKGVKICLRGIVCHDSWKDDSGNWKSFDYIIVQEWEFAESKAASQQNNGQTPGQQAPAAPAPSPSDFMSIDSDIDAAGIPF